jgi:hypothetical protein
MRHYNAGVAITVMLAISLVACESSGPPDAWAITKKLPGCEPVEAGGVPAQQFTHQELTCSHGRFYNIAVATFKTESSESKWVKANGGYVLKGSMWAALAGGTTGGPGSDLSTLQHYLGGTLQK